MKDTIYITNHGISIGTIPKDIEFEIVGYNGYKTFFKTDRDLTEEELNKYDIRKSYVIEK